MDGKKKKNKKKKGGSQSKLTEDVQNASAEEVVLLERDKGAAPLVDQLSRVSSTTDVQNVGVSESDIELDRHRVYEERFVKLQEEVRQLQEEKNQWLQKEASLDQKVKLLQNDVDSCIKKEAGLEEKLENLQRGNDSSIQKEAILEDRVKHVEGIKDLWILKETLFNEMASRLDEVNIRLQEQVKELKESRDSLIQENTQLRESIAVMESRVHHIETEAFLSRSTPAMVTESPAEEKLHYQSETSPPPLVEKREPEKTELVEKAKEVHIESGLHSVAADRSSTPKFVESAISIDHAPEYGQEMYPPDDIIPSVVITHNPFGIPNGVEDFSSPTVAAYRSRTPELDTVEGPVESAISIEYAPEYGQDMYPPGEIIPSVARTHNPFGIPEREDDFGSPSVVRQGLLLGMDNSRISEDVVLVPLDDIQVQEVQPTIEEEPLPISDAPLIGAPFRLISFFAKYVSGADLVHQDGAR